MRVAALLEAQVVVGADAGQQCQLLAAQSGNPAARAAHQPDVLGPQLLAPGPQELTEPIGLRHHQLSLILSPPIPGSMRPSGPCQAGSPWRSTPRHRPRPRKWRVMMESHPAVDADRIGVWGTSYAGGHAIVLGATDRRVRAVVAQVPTISGYQQSLRRVAPDLVPALEASF